MIGLASPDDHFGTHTHWVSPPILRNAAKKKSPLDESGIGVSRPPFPCFDLSAVSLAVLSTCVPSDKILRSKTLAAILLFRVSLLEPCFLW